MHNCTVLILFTVLASASVVHSYVYKNVYCSNTPTARYFPIGGELDGEYSLIRYSFRDRSGAGEGPPHCGKLSVSTIDSDQKQFQTTRQHPFINDMYNKTIKARITSEIISPGRWASNNGGLFVFANGPLGLARSLMFLNYRLETGGNRNVATFLYANCAQEWQGACPTCHDTPAMSEWGILVRSGLENEYYANTTLLGSIYDEVLIAADLPPVANMTIINYFQCDAIDV